MPDEGALGRETPTDGPRGMGVVKGAQGAPSGGNHVLTHPPTQASTWITTNIPPITLLYYLHSNTLVFFFSLLYILLIFFFSLIVRIKVKGGQPNSQPFNLSTFQPFSSTPDIQ